MRFFLVLITVLCCCAGELPFQPLTWAEAQHRAAAEHKPIFLAFFQPSSGPQQVTKHSFLQNDKTRHWLQTQAVAVLIDADAAPELVKMYQVSVYPGFLLLDAKGQVLYRYLSSCSAKQFLADSADAAVPGQLEQVARAKLAAKPKDVSLRYDLATKLLYSDQREASFQLVEQLMLEKRSGQHWQFPNFRLYQHLQACQLPAASAFLEAEYQFQAARVLQGQFDRASLRDFDLLPAMTGHPIAPLRQRLAAAKLAPKKLAVFDEVFADQLDR